MTVISDYEFEPIVEATAGFIEKLHAQAQVKGVNFPRAGELMQEAYAATTPERLRDVLLEAFDDYITDNQEAIDHLGNSTPKRIKHDDTE